MVDTQKLVILQAESWCTAYKQGARPGCMITHINHHPIWSWEDYARLAKSQKEFDMTLRFQSADQHRQAVVRSYVCFVWAAKERRIFTHSLILAHDRVRRNSRWRNSILE